MKFICRLFLMSSLLLAACLDDSDDAADDVVLSKASKDVVYCMTKELKNKSGYKIICDGDSVAVLKNGIDGKNGDDGEDGTSCYATPLDSALGYELFCGEKSIGIIWNGKDGKNAECSAEKIKDKESGKKGVSISCDGEDPVVVWDGENGEKGKDAECSAKKVTDKDSGKKGVSISCDGEDPVVVWDGENGEKGKDAECTAKKVTDEDSGKTGISVACGDEEPVVIWDGKDGEKGKDGDNAKCTTNKIADENTGRTGVSIKCGDEESLVVWDGKDGSGSLSGAASCSVEKVTDADDSEKTGYSLKCDGNDPVIIWNGKDGEKGEQGDKGDQGEPGVKGVSCTATAVTKDNKNGVSIKCGDDDPIYVWDGEKGEQGKQGDKGDQGLQGTSCTASDTTYEGKTGVAIKCGTANPVVVWNGEKGDAGAKGKSCTATAVTMDNKNGVKIECGESEPVYVWNGDKGDQGVQGTSCTASDTTYDGRAGVAVKCGTENSVVVWNGEQGNSGAGANISCSYKPFSNKETTGTSGFDITCGDATFRIYNGEDGAQGKSCTATAVTMDNKNGVKIECGESEPVYVWDGNDGESASEPESGTCSVRDTTNEMGDVGFAIFCDNKEPMVLWTSLVPRNILGQTYDDEKCATVRNTKTEFLPIENVIPCVKSNEKVAFIIRHGERGSDYSSTGRLNANGQKMAKNLGKRLIEFPDFYYMHTSVYRAVETAFYVAIGKEQTISDTAKWYTTSDKYHALSEDFGGEFFTKNCGSNCGCGTGWEDYAKMAYDVNACPKRFYNVDEKREEIVNRYFTYEIMHNITLVGSHDQFVAPFVISMTDRQMKNLNYHVTRNDNNWINYLAGAAIIVDNENNVTYVPVRGHNSGYLGKNDPDWTGL